MGVRLFLLILAIILFIGLIATVIQDIKDRNSDALLSSLSFLLITGVVILYLIFSV